MLNHHMCNDDLQSERTQRKSLHSAKEIHMDQG